MHSACAESPGMWDIGGPPRRQKAGCSTAHAGQPASRPDLWLGFHRLQPATGPDGEKTHSFSCSFCLSVCRPTYLPIIHPSIHPSIYLSSIHLFVYLPIIYTSIHLSTCLSVCLSIYLLSSINHLSTYLPANHPSSIYPSIHLSSLSSIYHHLTIPCIFLCHNAPRSRSSLSQQVAISALPLNSALTHHLLFQVPPLRIGAVFTPRPTQQPRHRSDPAPQLRGLVCRTAFTSQRMLQLKIPWVCIY